MAFEQLHEIQRYLASLRADQVVDVKAYATAISGGVKVSTRDLQDVIRREADALGVRWK